ncbi:hypothetical protein WICPIJ_001892 [Wickerhamomyces pijperi]|uniref:Casein kinase II subunit beta n=1 Tax=Wickerhamomyces pijperi TaxID=599730 RepID=A0A9P8QA00_WICPI|nr:hypothetical protein WICPIJ_001892 [Wickerhamomyces pijperi]
MGENDSSDFETWISNFCSLYGHDYYVEVGQDFIEDDFNLTGLSSIVPYYKEALDFILDLEPEHEIKIKDQALVQQSAEVLYGLIHARYIITKPGAQLMNEKYSKGQFGCCPRYACNGSKLLPIGINDTPGVETVRLFCPDCFDLYLPTSSRYLNIDGAFFGSTFPGFFIKMYGLDNPNLRPSDDLKIFGFKIHEGSNVGSRMKWLRATPSTDEELREFDEVD